MPKRTSPIRFDGMTIREIVLDTETTGLNPCRAIALVEIGSIGSSIAFRAKVFHSTSIPA